MKQPLLFCVGTGVLLVLACTYGFSGTSMDPPNWAPCENPNGPDVDPGDPYAVPAVCTPGCLDTGGQTVYDPEYCESGGDSRSEMNAPYIGDGPHPGPVEDPCGGGGDMVSTDNPVDLFHGHKTEKAVDVRVPLPGIDFVFSRKYMSTPEYAAAPLLGEKWSGSSFRFIDFQCCQAIGSGGYCVMVQCCTENPWPNSLDVQGPTSQSYSRSTLDNYAVWTLTEPGEWEIDFYRELHSFDEEGVQERDEVFIGLVAEMRDSYGNRHEYAYEVHGHEENQVARLKDVTFKDQMGHILGKATFHWWVNPLSGHLGRLDKIDVKRGSTEVLTAHYTYADSASHLGTENDLIQVHVRELTDNSQWRSRITQYRYHDAAYSPSGQPQYTFSGLDHQLKLIINPEQIEYYAQVRAAADGINALTLEEYAAELMLLDDEEVDTVTGWRPVDLAAKIISQYESTGSGRVLEQFLLTDCGCSGGEAGTRLTYDRFEWEKEVIGDDNIPGRTTRVTKSVSDGSGGWDEHEIVHYDLLLQGPGSVTNWDRPAYLITKAVEDAATNNQWVTHFIYDHDDRTLLRRLTPEATGTYSPSTEDDEPPVYTPASDGLVWAFSYDGQSRRLETRLGDGFLDTSLDHLDKFGDYTLLTRVAYGLDSGTEGEWDLTNGRPHLVRYVERFRDESESDPETTEYYYGFYGSDDDAPVAWRETRVEAEGAMENGPGGWFTSYSLYDTIGNEVWSYSADGVLTLREFDDDTGRVRLLVPNSTHDITPYGPALPDDHEGLDTTSWEDRYNSSESITYQYEYDAFGRLAKHTAPWEVKTYTRREMLPYPDRPGLLYYAEVNLPYKFNGGDCAGPATVTWYDAANRVVGSRDYIVDPGGSYPDTYSLGDIEEDYVSKRVVEHNHLGQTTSTTEWHDVENDRSSTTTFAYDRLGRLSYTIDDNGNVSRQEYDVHGRVIKVEMGVEDAGEPDESTMKQVAEYFYDHELDAGNPVQGVGNGNLTLVVQDVDGTETRTTEYRHDFRGRRLWTVNPLPPHEYTTYDNQNRVIQQAQYVSPPTGVTPPAVSDRGQYSEVDYSHRGLMYRQAVAIDPSDATPEFLESHTWFDPAGRPIAQLPPNGPMTKTQYDALGRTAATYTVAGVHQDYDDLYDDDTWEIIIDEPVVEQVEYSYLPNKGWLGLVTTRQRMHDVAPSVDGALDGSNSIATYFGMRYDNAGRRVVSIDYGTNNPLFKAGTSAPSIGSSGPSFGSSDLDTTTTYDARGRVATITDPEERVTAYFYDDLNRQVATIENYKNDPTIAWDTDRYKVTYPLGNADDENRVTSFVYDGVGNLIKQLAHQVDTGTSDTFQATLYNYGVTTSDSPLPSTVTSQHFLREIVYPEGESSPTAGDRTVTFAYNHLGEVTHMRDQNGTIHEYERDDAGRVTVDHVTTFGTGIDQAIDGIGTVYDDLGRVLLVRSYSDFNPLDPDADVANAVKYEYTGLGQVHKVIQEPFGDIDGSSRDVVYRYDDEAFATGNYSRLASLTYASTPGVAFDYGTSGTINSNISRIEAVEANVFDVIGYDYIGMRTMAVVDYRRPDVQLDRTAKANGERNASGHDDHSDGYPGYDRFGRVVRHMWVDGDFQPYIAGGPPSGSLHGETSKPHIPPIYELTHTYDKASNRLTRYNQTATLAWYHRHEEFAYDGLHRLTASHRGVRDGSFEHAMTSREWSLDMLGNWNETATWSAGGFNRVETRDHSDANELTSRTPHGGSALNFTYDKAGNLEIQETSGDTVTYTYDAWNRLVKIEYDTFTRAEYQYNGLNWRTVKRADTSLPPDGELNQQRVMYYNADWQLLEEFINDDWSPQSADDDHDRRMQYIWGMRYIDDIALRKEWDAWSIVGTGNPLHTWYHLTDTLFSTIAVMDEAANLIERVSYDAYGNAQHHRIGDVNGDGSTNFKDRDLIIEWMGGITTGLGDYGVGDLNRDGVVNYTDASICFADYGAALPIGQLSATDNVIGYAGYVFNAEMHGSGLYTVRHRHYSPELGRWLTRDPLGYVDGMSLYEYVRSAPSRTMDPLGLAATCDDPCDHCENRYPPGTRRGACIVGCNFTFGFDEDEYSCADCDVLWDPETSPVENDACRDGCAAGARPATGPAKTIIVTQPTIAPRWHRHCRILGALVGGVGTVTCFVCPPAGVVTCVAGLGIGVLPEIVDELREIPGFTFNDDMLEPDYWEHSVPHPVRRRDTPDRYRNPPPGVPW